MKEENLRQLAAEVIEDAKLKVKELPDPWIALQRRVEAAPKLAETLLKALDVVEAARPLSKTDTYVAFQRDLDNLFKALKAFDEGKGET